MTGMMRPKTSQATKDAERRAAEAEAKAAKDSRQSEVDNKYRIEKQRGKLSTILSSEGSSTGTTKTLLGG